MTHVCPDEDRADPPEEESAARELLAPYLRGDLRVWDDRSADRMWDFCLVDDRVHLASLEVTTSTKQELMRFHAQLDEIGSAWPAPDGVGCDWYIQFQNEARPKRIYREQEQLFDFLARAEEEGQHTIFWKAEDAWALEGAELGLATAIARPTRGEATLFIHSETETWIGEDLVSDSFLRQASANEEKLRGAVGERHLFVWFPFFDHGSAFEMRRPPSGSPVELPDFVDVAWAGSRAFSLERPTLWRSTAGRPWELLQRS